MQAGSNPLDFVAQRLDEIGRMIGGWIKSLPHSLNKFPPPDGGLKIKGNQEKE